MATKTVSVVSLSGRAITDSLLSNLKWGNAALTFSFRTVAPTTEYRQGFAELNEAQKNAVREVLVKWASVCNLTFSEIADSSDSILRFGTCSSSVVETSEAYYPSTSSSGGNVWFGNSNSSSPTNPEQGNYAYDTIVHEIGHALGLKHPHEAEGLFPVADLSIDAMQYSVMSYRSYVGGSVSGGYSNAAGSYVYGPMINDIAAVQYLYGANYNANSGSTIYTFSPSQTKMFRSIWDGGGNDTYDCSQYTSDLSIDLDPGAWSTFADSQIADLGNGNKAPGNVQNAYLYNNNVVSLIENANGGWGNDVLSGNAGNNALRGAGGVDQLWGGGGNDQLWGGAGEDRLNDGYGSNAFWWGYSEGNDVVSSTTSRDAMIFYNFSFAQRTCSIDIDGNLMFGSKIGNADNIILAGWKNQASASRLQNFVFKENGTYKNYAWNYQYSVVASLSDSALASNNVHYLECVDTSNATLRGSTGNDTIKGGAGNDLVWAGSGDDWMVGGTGLDTFYWGAGDGNDVIADASSGEAVMLYSSGLTTANVSAAILGTAMRLTLSTGNTLDIFNWNTAGINKFVFGMSATTTNTYSLAASGSQYVWQRI